MLVTGWLALKKRVPALAVDPVAGGAKVAAQARAWSWPAVVTVPEAEGVPLLDPAELDRWWEWALSPHGRARASVPPPADTMVGELLDVLGAR